MDVGLALPAFDASVPGERPLQWSTVVATARRAEDLGFQSIWLPDHLFFAVGEGRDGSIDPIVSLAGLARQTRRLRLGTLVLCAPRRPATVVAKALATLDVLADGRLTVGIGAGRHEPDFGRLAETIEVLKGMWRGGPFTFTGTYVNAKNAYCLPRPLQRPHPPVWVGGRGDRVLDIAARHADGWNAAWTQAPEDYLRRTTGLEAACERVGRDPASLHRSLGLYALVGENRADLVRRFDRMREAAPGRVLRGSSLEEWRRGRLVGTVEEVREQLAGWDALGVSTLIVGAGAVPFAMTSADDLVMIAAATGARAAPPEREA